ncbi:ABC transporter permease [Chloroflexota bacterium]
MKPSTTTHLRIIWAITAKDIVDAVKNKNVLGIIIPALFMIVLYRFMPAITAEDGPPALLVYDTGNPVMMSLLEESPAVDLYSYESETQMLNYLSNGEQPELGLVIPAGFDQKVEFEQSLILQGFMLHFFTDEQVSELQRDIQDELEYLLDQPVTILIERVQLQPEAHGITILASMGFGFIIIMVGMIAIPHMMLEEKQNKTLEAILVSPAGSLHIIAAKALTGLLYTMIVFGIGMVLFRSEIVNWGLALLAGLLGALFAVSLGLLLGILVDTRQQLVLWAWVGLVPIFLPMMLSIMDDLLPHQMIQIVKWVPSSALMRAMRSTMVGNPPVVNYLPQLGILLFSATLVFVLDIWLVRRLDR